MNTPLPDNANPAALWALRSQNVVMPAGVRPAAVLVQGEQIAAVIGPEEVPSACPVEDIGEKFLLPGLVDAHVHVNEPGRTEWEGFNTATRAAAAGGVTTLIDMPLNSSPVTTVPLALTRKLAAANGQLWVDAGFYGGVVPGNAKRVEPLADMGVLGFKAFLCHSGIDEFPNVPEAELREVMPKLAALGLPLLVHAELVSPLPSSVESRHAADPRSYSAYLATRPPQWEHDAIQLVFGLAWEYGCRVHIVHLSSADALPLIAQARTDGLPVTVETCPHYLFFAAEEIPDGAPLFKCAPPIRGRANRDRLWQGFREGLIDTIGSDHSPAPPERKYLRSGDLAQAWGGIASLQLLLPAAWTAARQRNVPLAELIPALTRRPAQLLGLDGRKGLIAPGRDADLVVFDPNFEFIVTPGMLHHRHPATPYEGCRLRGLVEATYLRGCKVFDSGRFRTSPTGQVLLRKR